jgi:acetate---CoA ligase (ADP-forming)
MGNLAGLFQPQGIAIVGASRDLARGGGQPLKALLESGYAGAIYPINPKYDELAGLRCYKSVRDVDGRCDLAVIALPAAGAVAAVRDCAAKGVGYAVLYSGGFRETGAQGLALERELLEVARNGGVRLIGPNCLGVVNVVDHVYAAFGSLTRPPRLKAGCVSMVVQSGGFGYSLALRCAEMDVGFRYVVASGNETDVTTPELIDHYLDDPVTKVVFSYLEGVSDGRALMEVGRKAAALGKPILLWKAGRKEQGLKAAASHTASMTGRYEIYHAALQQSGIIEVFSIDELASLVKVFSSGKLPRGPRVGLMSASGGSAIVFADACDEEGMTLPLLSENTVTAIRKFVPSVGAVSNPVDFAAGFLNDGSAENFVGALDLVLADENIDQVCVLLATVQGKQALNGARIMAAAAQRSPKPILVFSSTPRNTAVEALRTLEEAGIPVLSSPVHLARAAAVTSRYKARTEQVRNMAPLQTGGVQRPSDGPRSVLNEVESRALLTAHGFPRTNDVVVSAGHKAPRNTITYPVAAKVISRDLPHKSDVSGVRLNIRNDEELDAAITEIYKAVARAVPKAKIDGILVSEMVCDAVEVIVGVINDDVFGPTVLMGLGGTLTEVLHDVGYRVAPFDVATAEAMITSLRGSAIFRGVRGRPACDVAALAQAVSRVSRMAWELRDTLVELDINPMFVRTPGKGVVIGDALAVLRSY